jgi:site-specific DNA-methyltransferase (adenine-specific)
MLKLIHSDVLTADLSGVPPINLVVTSPPYNVGIEYDKHDDTMTYEEYLKWCKLWLKKVYDAMAEDGRICINIPFTINPAHSTSRKRGSFENHINYPVVADYTHIAQSVGFTYYRTMIWQKMGSNKTCWGSWMSARAPFVIDPNECILVFYKGTWKRKDKGTSTITKHEFMTYIKNLWLMNPQTKSKHPAAFPTELPKRCIKLFSYREDTVMDCFMGSGTTGEIATQLGRNFVGVEMSQNYFDEAKVRIENAETIAQISEKVMPEDPADEGESW